MTQGAQVPTKAFRHPLMEQAREQLVKLGTWNVPQRAWIVPVSQYDEAMRVCEAFRVQGTARPTGVPSMSTGPATKPATTPGQAARAAKPSDGATLPVPTSGIPPQRVMVRQTAIQAAVVIHGLDRNGLGTSYLFELASEIEDWILRP